MNPSANPADRLKYAPAFTLPIVLLVSFASLAGILRPELYRNETADWLAQTSAQDLIDLFLVVPVITFSGWYVFRGEWLARSIWGGTLVYLVYTFILYCFALHFNTLFLVYVGVLGLSTYGFIYYFRMENRNPSLVRVPSRVRSVLSVYFMVIAAGFFLLWLADVVPAILQGTLPAAIEKAGLTTNPVQVLDLSFVLPGLFIIGLLLRRNHPLGLLFAPVALVFFVLMDITILVIFLAQQAAGTPLEPVGLSILSALTVISLAALWWLLSSKEE